MDETGATGLLADVTLPDQSADEEEIDRRVAQPAAVTEPVTGAEARALATCFGSDDCYGVAWTLLHLVETGPNLVLAAEPAPDSGEWHHRLWGRIVNSGPASSA
ncbi:hypothetical protein [Kitasatospora purpeofusca]|uniref:hypothetical protein n=1 Tax=Kitasatospora purpeofusca TaxID=67352 RepID=UPI0038063EA7